MGAAVAGTALAVCAGPPSAPQKVYRVGYLSGSTQAETAAEIDAFRQAMRQLGYVDGRNLEIEIRWAEGNAEREPALAAELLALKPAVIVVRAVPEALVLKRATSTIPIVLAGTPDPVENGLVASLARPGGNITGAWSVGPEATQRRLQLLKETVPGAARVGYFFDASNAVQARGYQQAQSAAPSLAIELLPVEVRSAQDFPDAFAAAERLHLDAVFVGGGALMSTQRSQILAFLTANRLPAITPSTRDYVDNGALLSFGEDGVDAVLRAVPYVDRILKGANPSDLPIEKAAKFDLIINMRTAKALGLTIPASVLAQATELIQ